jgi:hypothetical protein
MWRERAEFGGQFLGRQYGPRPFERHSKGYHGVDFATIRTGRYRGKRSPVGVPASGLGMLPAPVALGRIAGS